MQYRLIIQAAGSVEPPVIPGAYLLPGSGPSAWAGGGRFYLQALTAGEYSLHYLVLEPAEDGTAYCQGPGSDTQLCISLEGGLPGLPQYYFTLQPAKMIEIPYTGGQVYRFLLASRPGSQTVSVLSKAGPAMMGHVYTLLHTPFIETMKAFYEATIGLLWQEALLYTKPAGPLPLYTEEVIRRVREARAFIEKNLDTHFTIAALARKAGLNRQQFKQGFKAMYQEGPYGCLLRLRLERAKTVLQETRRPLKQVAAQAGYHSAGNFSYAFKKRFGLSPLAARKAAQAR